MLKCSDHCLQGWPGDLLQRAHPGAQHRPGGDHAPRARAEVPEEVGADGDQ